jgi:cell division septum initiation protein DivIVA
VTSSAGAAEVTAPQPVPEAPEQAALRIITMAQRTADEAIADARREAEQILAAARREADEALGEARDKHRSIVGALEAQQEQLERRVADLDALAREHRSRLRAHLEAQLRELDAREDPPVPARLGALPIGEPEQR